MKLTFQLAVTSIIISMFACSRPDPIVTDIKDHGGFSNNSSTVISLKDKKFLCDFRWTKGYKALDYAINDNPVGKLGDGNSKDSWCLIPYNETTEYKITDTDTSKQHYVCRDNNATYSMLNETDILIEVGAHENMKCISLDSNSVTVTAGTAGNDYMDEKLYHIVQDDTLFRISGHINLRLVKPVQLSVLIQIFHNNGRNNVGDPYNKNVNCNTNANNMPMFNSFIDNMKKVGIQLELYCADIVLPHADIEYASLTPDGIISLLELKEVNKLTNAYAYDYFIGATSISLETSQGFDALHYITEGQNVFLPKVFLEETTERARGILLTNPDFFDDFFNRNAEYRGRRLASLLYSMILRKNPMTSDNGQLSSYPKQKSATDDNLANIDQPSDDWKVRYGHTAQIKNLEFAKYMQRVEPKIAAK